MRTTALTVSGRGVTRGGAEAQHRAKTQIHSGNTREKEEGRSLAVTSAQYDLCSHGGPAELAISTKNCCLNYSGQQLLFLCWFTAFFTKSQRVEQLREA